MIITCEKCDTSFNLDESLLKQTGSKVRCSKCKNIFLAYPPMPSGKSDQSVEIEPNLEAGKKPESFEYDREPEEDELFQEESEAKTAASESHSKSVGELEEGDAGLDDLDLSGIDRMFQAEEEPESKKASDIVLEDSELEMDIGSESERQAEAAELKSEFEEEDLTLSNLDRMLEAGDEEKTGEASAAGKEDFELEAEDFDLSDIEQMLEKEEAEEEDIGMEPEELDLSDLDKMLDIEEEKEVKEKPEKEMEELDLELDLEEVTGDEEENNKTDSLNDMPELEISEIDETDDDKEKSEAEKSSEVEDMELEFQVDDSEPESMAEEEALDEQLAEDKSVVTEAKSGTEVQTDPSIAGETQEEAAEEEMQAHALADTKTKPAGKKRIGKTFLVLAILVILLGGAFGGLLFFQHKGIEIPYLKNIDIPFVSDWLKPKVQDAGNLKMRTLEINSRFMDNSRNGKLFIITGKARNDYSEARCSIKVAGKLYSKGKNIIKTETVYCGNVLSDLELSAMEFETIKNRLSNPDGNVRANVSVQPKKLIPFMIVFSELPEDLEEFTIEVLESSPLKK